MFNNSKYTTSKEASVQYPVPTDGDSVYAKDVWTDESVTTGWTDANNTGLNLALIPFTNLHSAIEYTGTDNPKTLLIHFNRTVDLDQVALGCADHPGENFSNVKVIALGSGGAEQVVKDESADNTKYTSRDYQFGSNKANAVKIEFHTADDVMITNINISKVQKSLSQLRAERDDGTVVSLKASDANNLRVTDAESGLAIAKGEVPGSSFIHKFGEAPDFDQGDGSVTVWDGADDGNINQMIYQYSSTADIDSISSDNVADTQNIEVQGLDANYALVTQTVALNGQTTVALTTPLIRVFRAKNTSSSDLAGYVYVYVNGTTTGGIPNTATDVRAVIRNGLNQTLMAVYTIPAGKTGYMRDWFAASAGASKSTNYKMILKARPFGEVFQVKHVSSVSDTGSSHIQHKYNEPEVFTEKTDIEMTSEMLSAGATGGDIGAGFDIVLVDN